MGERVKLCDYEMRQAYGQRRTCRNPAHWIVTYTTPDDGRVMRTRAIAIRCFWHRDTGFLPKGATQVATESTDHAALFAAPNASPSSHGP